MKFTFKEVIWTIIFILVTAFLVSGSSYAFIQFAQSGSDWISALLGFNGNIIGGIIGGIVAFIIAKYQIFRSKVEEETKQKETTITMLKLIREELKDNISVLSNALPYTLENYNIMRASISDDTWKSTMLHLFIEEELLVKIHVCYKKVSLIRNLSAEELDDSVISNCKITIENTIEKVKDYISMNQN